MFAVLGEAAEEMMRAGCADYVVAQQPVVIGRSAVRMMDALVKGKPLEQKKDEVALIPVTMANLNSLDKSSIPAPKGWTPSPLLRLTPPSPAPRLKPPRITPL